MKSSIYRLRIDLNDFMHYNEHREVEPWVVCFTIWDFDKEIVYDNTPRKDGQANLAVPFNRNTIITLITGKEYA